MYASCEAVVVRFGGTVLAAYLLQVHVSLNLLARRQGENCEAVVFHTCEC